MKERARPTVFRTKVFSTGIHDGVGTTPTFAVFASPTNVQFTSLLFDLANGVVW